MLQVLVGEARRIAARLRKVSVGVAALHHHGEIGRVQLARCQLGGLDVLGCLDRGQRGGDVFRRAHPRTAPAAGAHRLHGQTMRQHRVMADLVQPRERQLEAGGEVAGLMALLHEGLHLVDSEDLAHAIGQPAGDVRRVLAERLGGVARFPAAAIL